ncbi:MAG: toxin-antitoxin system, toxin component, HicA family protein [Faecalibacterium sp.]|nr:toxin-antitoxin system, toxin component, HicA family protein [Faecalibacterium sp.]
MGNRSVRGFCFCNGGVRAGQGSNHMVFTNGSETEIVPRHKEVNELLAKAIIKRRGLK